MTPAEGWVDVPGGRVRYWSYGDGSDGRAPLLCLHGGPGAPHDYLLPFSELADERRVVFYDQLGCGESDKPDDRSLWTVERFMDELSAVRDALGLERVHLFGSSWGGMLAMQYVLDRGRPPLTLCMAGSPASSPRWNEICQELLDEMPADEREEIERLENEGKMESPEYEEAMMPFYTRHVCRLDPWPQFVVDAFAWIDLDPTVYHTMNGPSEFHVIGSIKDWQSKDRLADIDAPTLLVSGRYDEATPALQEALRDGIRDCEWVLFDESSHLPHVEEPARYREVVGAWLRRRD